VLELPTPPGWRTNWQTKSPSAVCQRTNENLVDVFDRLRHFSGDARLFWSMEDATTPSGTQLSKAFPKDNFGEWMPRTTIWSTHLAPCP
jgi:hypothetical protein